MQRVDLDGGQTINAENPAGFDRTVKLLIRCAKTGRSPLTRSARGTRAALATRRTGDVAVLVRANV